ncbi:MAG TPA: TatD family hydrolase [Planctomycetia bacterium]|nr:TatD family hydrolase [Planctomycetia bacterium]
MPIWIDTHSHLNDERFADRMDEVLAEAETAGVARSLVIGIDVESSRRAVELAERYPALLAVVGIQPNSLSEAGPDDFAAIAELARHPRTCAVGETGMDRYWDRAPIALQRESFLRHLALADELDLPFVVHCRQAEPDVVEVLSERAASTRRPLRGVMHSYSGDLATALACLDLGMHVSFAGMVTFKNAAALREVAKAVPADRILVETDSPYLSPEPFRGKENRPSRVAMTGERLAKERGVAAAEFAVATTANANRLFRLDRFDGPPIVKSQRSE